jgi:phage/plasmid-like protein (TIGR03299 family)
MMNNASPGQKWPGYFYAQNKSKEELKMAANVETMFYTRTAPWHGLGTRVLEAPTSSAALSLAGLDWRVIQKPVLTEDGLFISGFKANVRDRDNQVLGVVSDRYKVVQNEDAFAFTDELLGEGVTYETAGSLQNGRRTWILAKLPQRYIISGDKIDPYLVFMNSHDGTGAIKAAMTPIRVVCQNTLNLALSTARRSWSTIHTGDIHGKLQDARNTLLYADRYMAALGKTIEELSRQKLSDRQVLEYIDALFPFPEDASEARKKNLGKLKEDLKLRYFDAPDLQHVGKNAYRFVNAVSDFATHARPLRERSSYRESLFGRTVDGNVLIDRAFGLVKAA